MRKTFRHIFSLIESKSNRFDVSHTAKKATTTKNGPCQQSAGIIGDGGRKNCCWRWRRHQISGHNEINVQSIFFFDQTRKIWHFGRNIIHARKQMSMKPKEEKLSTTTNQHVKALILMLCCCFFLHWFIHSNSFVHRWVSTHPKQWSKEKMRKKHIIQYSFFSLNTHTYMI